MTQLITLDELDTSPQKRERLSGGSVSIGNFDGVHWGHRDLLARTVAAARRIGGPALAVILDPHPATVLRPHSAPARLTTVDRRAELMGPLGIDFLVVCPATREFLHRTADEFFEFLILDRLSARAMVEGPNFFFGRDRGGDLNRLAKLCRQSDVALEIVQPRVEDERMISSSRIREAIAAGELQAAAAMLGTPYQLSGWVGAGEGRGRRIGFPTANLCRTETLVPGDGVYAATATLDEDEPSCLAAVHIGPNPTFSEDRETKVEVHLLDYAGDLYDRRLSVQFREKIRDVQTFDGPDELVEQLRQDVQLVRDKLGNPFQR